MSLERSYYGAVKALTANRSGQTTLEPADGGGLVATRQLKQKYVWSTHLYADEGSKRGRFPSVSWLIDRWHDYSDSRAEYFDRHMMVLLALTLLLIIHELSYLTFEALALPHDS